jgi:hypothetical protein
MKSMWDFGFTAVTEDELEVVQKAAAQVQDSTASASDYQEKLQNLYNAVIPLLQNLKKNPDKNYIYWPNRTAKIEEFETHIQQITGYGPK